MMQFLINLVPWLLIIGAAYFFLFRQLRTVQLPSEADNPTVYQPQTLIADANGVSFREPHTYTEYQWEAFWTFDETDRAFVLYTSDPKSRIITFRMMPKSAMAGAAEMDQFRTLLSEHIHIPSAFPVVPARSAAIAVEQIDEAMDKRGA